MNQPASTGVNEFTLNFNLNTQLIFTTANGNGITAQLFVGSTPLSGSVQYSGGQFSFVNSSSLNLLQSSI